MSALDVDELFSELKQKIEEILLMSLTTSIALEKEAELSVCSSNLLLELARKIRAIKIVEDYEYAEPQAEE